jgi:cytochrome b561
VKLLNTKSSYGIISRALHWVIVFAIVGQWALAESEQVPLHQSIGIVILVLAVVTCRAARAGRHQTLDRAQGRAERQTRLSGYPPGLFQNGFAAQALMFRS